MEQLDKTTAEQDEVDIDLVDTIRINELIPHRPPILMIDRIRAIRLSQSAVGIKNVTINEPFFAGHFPGSPIMPGVLIIEAMAQTAACLVALSLGKEAEGKLVYFMTIDNARFRKPVVPGDRMEVVVQKIRNRNSIWKFSGKVYVDGDVVANAEFSALLRLDS